MLRVSLAIDHAVVRWALARALAVESDLEIAGTGPVAGMLARIAGERPQVVLVDPTTSETTRFDLLAELARLDHAPFVIVISSHEQPSYLARVIGTGIHGLVSPSSDPAQLLDTIHAVSRGELRLPPVPRLAGSGDLVHSLTGRELQVMEMIARGMTNREISEHLGISVKTFDTHRGHVLKKLGLRNNSELTRFAVRHGHVVT